MYSKSRMIREYRLEIEAVETEFMPKGGFPEEYVPIVPNDEEINTLEEYLVALKAAIKDVQNGADPEIYNW